MSQALSSLPDGFAATVRALHRVAAEVVAPERKPDNEIALEATPGGFGTPPFEWEGERRRVRVEGTDLVRERDGAQEREPLGVDPDGAAALAGWFEFGSELLDRLRGEAHVLEAPTRPILWPEHFDVAIEMGEEAKGRRATYGFSPGDEEHAEPYAYVAPWSERAGPLWDARGFRGAELGYSLLLASGDPWLEALDFMRDRRDALGENKTNEEEK